jgi:hypothetical protein
VFQALIDRSRAPLDLKTIKTILGYKHRPKNRRRTKRSAGLIWARVGDRGMPSRYTDTLAVMQRRGLITPQMRQAAVVGDHLTLDEAVALHRRRQSRH